MNIRIHNSKSGSAIEPITEGSDGGSLLEILQDWSSRKGKEEDLGNLSRSGEKSGKLSNSLMLTSGKINYYEVC